MSVAQQVARQLGDRIFLVGDSVIIALTRNEVDESNVPCHWRAIGVLVGSQRGIES